MNRFLIIILGTATGIDKDLNFIADGEQGVNFVDGKGMFICTFYSPYTASEIHERMAHRPDRECVGRETRRRHADAASQNRCAQDRRRD